MGNDANYICDYKEITNPEYWDCPCLENYIHKKSETLVCPRCGAKEEDNPDSMSNEVECMLKGIEIN